MWNGLLAWSFVLHLAGKSIGVSCTRFGHEPLAYNVPNLIPPDGSEMNYIPTSPSKQTNRWYSSHLNTQVINDAGSCFSGLSCLKTINRAQVTDTLFYRVSYDLLEAGHTYVFNVFIKLTQSAHELVKISALSRSWYIQDKTKADYFFYTSSYHKVEDHWLLFSMDLKVTQQAKNKYSLVDFYLKLDNYTDFIIDAASLTKVHYPNWKADANSNITAYRTGKIVFNFHPSGNLDLNKLKIEVTQKRRHFPFGVAVNAKVIAGYGEQSYVQRYRSWVENRATWAVFLNAAKWKPMEPDKPDNTNDKFKVADDALMWLTLKKIRVRGHAVHWNKLSSTPSWVAKKPDKLAEINRRTNYVVQHFRGRFRHWDVCNEFTNSRLYQNWLGREDVLEYLHEEVAKNDPNVKRFINEWGNLDSRLHFADTVNAALRLKERQLIEGIGLQAHMKPKGDQLDMELIKRRLEILTGLGIPVWITELTVSHKDAVVRGRLLADCLTLFYGTPGVHGVLLWDFAPVNNEKMMSCALASPDVQNNAAGDKYDEMLASWSTNLVVQPSSGEDQVSKDVFYGTHDITMYYDGVQKAQLTKVQVTPKSNVFHLDCNFGTTFSITQS